MNWHNTSSINLNGAYRSVGKCGYIDFEGRCEEEIDEAQAIGRDDDDVSEEHLRNAFIEKATSTIKETWCDCGGTAIMKTGAARCLVANR